MFRALIAGALMWAIAGPALALIGTPVELGMATANAVYTVSLNPLLASVPAGDTIVIAAGSEGNEYITGCNDSANPGVAYTIGNKVSPSGAAANLAWSTPIINALPTNGAITCTWSGNTRNHMLGAVDVPGVTGFDQQPPNTTGATATPMIHTGVLAQANDELAFFELVGAGEGGAMGYMEDTTVEPDFAINKDTAGASTVRLSHKTPPNRGVVLYSPQFGMAYNWGVKAVVFTGPEIPPIKRRNSYALRGALSAPPQGNPVVWGYQYDTSGNFAYQTTVPALPAAIFRLGVNNSEDSPTQNQYKNPIDWLVSHNDVHLLLNVKNRNSALNLSVPPDDSVDYENSLTTFFKSFIDDRHATIGLVTIENEEDSGNNYQEHGDCTDGNLAQCDATAAATAGDYAAQLARAVAVAHPLGLKVANGGFSSSGIDLWYWYYLHHLGLQYEADQYALYAFAGVNDDGAKASNLPSLADPNHAIFPGNPAAYLHMMQITDMVALIKASGIDYVSVHFLSGGPFPGPKYDALQALVQAVGLPAVSDAVGIKQPDAGTTWGVLDMGPKLGMPIASWFGGAPQEMGIDRAWPIADPMTGALNNLGHIYHCVIIPTATDCL